MYRQCSDENRCLSYPVQTALITIINSKMQIALKNMQHWKYRYGITMQVIANTTFFKITSAESGKQYTSTVHALIASRDTSVNIDAVGGQEQLIFYFNLSYKNLRDYGRSHFWFTHLHI